eukprot:contig_7724_g1815
MTFCGLLLDVAVGTRRDVDAALLSRVSSPAWCCCSSPWVTTTAVWWGGVLSEHRVGELVTGQQRLLLVEGVAYITSWVFVPCAFSRRGGTW